jgi:hypothetical protein
MASRGQVDFGQETYKLEASKHAHDRWWQEDELVNQRTTWLLTTQGVLGTAYGFLLYRIAEVKYTVELQEKLEAGLYIDALTTLANIVALIGSGSAFVSFIGILAACIAQHSLSKLYRKNLGVTKLTTWTGHAVAAATPLLCILAWAYLWRNFPESFPEISPLWPRPVFSN